MKSLSSAEAHRFLRAVAGSVPCASSGCRNIPDPWYAAQCPVPLAALARLAGVGYRTIKHAIHGERHVAPGGLTSGWTVPGIGEPTLIKLSPFVRAIEDGRLVFIRSGPGWNDVWLEPPFISGRQETIVDVDAWDYWRRCARCCGRKWSPIQLNGQALVACHACFPPSQWPSLRATPRTERLVLRLIERIDFAA